MDLPVCTHAVHRGEERLDEIHQHAEQLQPVLSGGREGDDQILQGDRSGRDPIWRNGFGPTREAGRGRDGQVEDGRHVRRGSDGRGQGD